jgi:outer membrane receptor protein involved in Fe transport
MKRQVLLLALVLAVLALPGAAAGQTLTGAISGKVVDEQGGVLPGATVTCTGKTGSQIQVADAKGEFRFVALSPGYYDVKAELQGFKPKGESAIDVGANKAIEVRLALSVGGLTETVEVTASAVTVDTSTTATDTNLNSDLLFSMPMSRTNAAANTLNYAPGVNSGSAFGGNSDYANALLLDGVDTRDPEGGSAWTFFNYNIIEEVQVGGLGQPAEYGGFTGAVVNTITKSGGNRFSSLYEMRFTNSSLAGKNVTTAIKGLNPTLGDVAKIRKMTDYTVQLGGPFVKNKLFFFGSIQRYSINDDPSGPTTKHTELSPRFNLKLTWQPTPSDTVTGSVQYDNYNVTGRGGNTVPDERTVNQDSPEWIWNAQYRKVFGASTFLEAKFTGYWGYYDLTPINTKPWHYDYDTSATSGGGANNSKYDRTRNQLNVALTRYANLAGQHTFKFGVEIERSSIRDRTIPANPGGVFFYDYSLGGGVPYAVGYSYDLKGQNNRVSYYGQDQWKLGGRVTLNAGVRIDDIRGYATDLKKNLYSNTSIGPRVGVAWDVSGNGTSVARAYYGVLYEGANFMTWSWAAPGASDTVYYTVNSVNGIGVSVGKEYDRIPAENKYTVASNIKHPRTNEFNVAFEQQFLRDFKVTATYIRRTNQNFIGPVMPNATWTTANYTVAGASTKRDGTPQTAIPQAGQTMTVYRWANRASIPQQFIVENVDNFNYVDPTGKSLGSINGYRDYNGVMLVVQRALRNRWQGQLSYVWSKTKGTMNNDGSEGTSSSLFATPNRALIYKDGLASYDRTHEFKLYLGYQIPVVEVMLGTYARYVTGTPYTANVSVSSGTINYTSSQTVNIAPRGAYRNDSLTEVNLRAEKVFQYGVHRFGIYADVSNLLNNVTVTGRNGRWPYTTITDSNSVGQRVMFGDPTSINSPRQIILGARWSF